jgi:anti-sigma factor RsiW
MTDLTCAELVELVTAYLDGALDPAASQRFEDHLAECPDCATYVEQFRVTIAQLGAIRVDSLSPDAELHLLDAFRGLAR